MAKRSAKRAGKAPRAKKAPKPAARRKLPTHEKLPIYRPDDLALSVSKLFPKEAEDWKHAASDQGFLRIRPAVMQGIVGLYGSLALGNPPSPVDLLDHWEASKPKDCWDYWSLFDFISVPTEEKNGGLDVVIFHHANSFQERPLEVAFRIHLPKTEAESWIQEQSDDFHNATESESLEREWTRLRQALERKFGAADLRTQTWTVDGKAYDITFPDQ
jgi:hypothetical protein